MDLLNYLNWTHLTRLSPKDDILSWTFATSAQILIHYEKGVPPTSEELAKKLESKKDHWTSVKLPVPCWSPNG